MNKEATMETQFGLGHHTPISHAGSQVRGEVINGLEFLNDMAQDDGSGDTLPRDLRALVRRHGVRDVLNAIHDAVLVCGELREECAGDFNDDEDPVEDLVVASRMLTFCRRLRSVIEVLR